MFLSGGQSDVIKGEELGSRVIVAQGDFITENQPK